MPNLKTLVGNVYVCGCDVISGLKGMLISLTSLHVTSFIIFNASLCTAEVNVNLFRRLHVNKTLVTSYPVFEARSGVECVQTCVNTDKYYGASYDRNNNECVCLTQEDVESANWTDTEWGAVYVKHNLENVSTVRTLCIVCLKYSVRSKSTRLQYAYCGVTLQKKQCARSKVQSLIMAASYQRVKDGTSCSLV